MTEEAYLRWDTALTELERLYRSIEKRSLSLPAFSLLPMAINLWNITKFYFCLWLDILLLLPMNAVILLRNLFPGKWRYRSFSGRYWRYTITWLWSGESPFAPIGVIRSLATFLLVSHFHNRIDSLKRYILLDDSLSDQDRPRVQTQIARMQELWKRPTATQMMYSYVLPASGPFIELYRFFFPSNFAPWVPTLVLFLITYSLAFVVSAFMVKRALMLGASGRALYFPGAIVGAGCYVKEREILGSLDVRKKEFPFDIAYTIVAFPIGYFISRPLANFYKSMGIATSPRTLLVEALIEGLAFALLAGLAVCRRNATGRL